jgi:hypothetical protein
MEMAEGVSLLLKILNLQHVDFKNKLLRSHTGRFENV